MQPIISQGQQAQLRVGGRKFGHFISYRMKSDRACPGRTRLSAVLDYDIPEGSSYGSNLGAILLLRSPARESERCAGMKEKPREFAENLQIPAAFLLHSPYNSDTENNGADSKVQNYTGSRLLYKNDIRAAFKLVEK